MRPWIDIATITKTKGSKGRLTARYTVSLPFALAKGMRVSFVPPKLDVIRQATISDIEYMDNGMVELEFEEVSEFDLAMELVGMHCLIRRDLLDIDSIEDHPELWKGWALTDDALGPIGEVIGFVDNPSQSLIEVERFDGRGTVLVPLVDEIVYSVDELSEEIAARLPKGLLDL